jgi:hypothetical protein
MEAEHDFAVGRRFDAQPLRADGHRAVGADLDKGAHTPHIGSPRAVRGRSDNGTVLFLGLVPGPLRGLPDFGVWGRASYPLC